MTRNLDHRDEMLRALLRLAREDPDAQLAVLFVVRPGLSRVSRRYSPFWGEEDSDAAVVHCALERMRSMDVDGAARPAADVVHGVRNTLWRRRLREGSTEALTSEPLDTEVASQAEVTAPGDLVMRIVDEALRRGVLSRRGARLILLHRLCDVPNRSLAAMEGRDPVATRKYRNRAEAALAEVAEIVA